MNDSFLRRTWVEIDLDAIESNFREVKQKVPGAKMMAVVKADAYGHGVEQVAHTLAQAGADWFGVSNLEEAIQLRALGHTLPAPRLASLVFGRIRRRLIRSSDRRRRNGSNPS